MVCSLVQTTFRISPLHGDVHCEDYRPVAIGPRLDGHLLELSQLLQTKPHHTQNFLVTHSPEVDMQTSTELLDKVAIALVVELFRIQTTEEFARVEFTQTI